jgi:hypothetical protein
METEEEEVEKIDMFGAGNAYDPRNTGGLLTKKEFVLLLTMLMLACFMVGWIIDIMGVWLTGDSRIFFNRVAMDGEHRYEL